MSDKQIVSRDLRILEAMAEGIGAYLMSESTRWPMARADMPRLTIGGCLMRRDRLLALRDQLSAAEQKQLQAAVKQLEQSLAEKVIRFERRAHQELHARLGEWAGHLRGMKSNMLADIEHFANIVDTRVVVAATVDALRQPPYKLDEQVVRELAQLDRHLRRRWQPGEFIWPAVWQPAYPPDTYWYLYGRRKQMREQ